jgi:hypothetical protein
MNIFDRVKFTRRIRQLFAVKVTDSRRDDSTWRSVTANTYPRDRYPQDRDEVLQDALDAWRDNALARRVIELTTEFVVGNGLQITCEHEATHHFMQEWWNHPKNNMPQRIYEWCDELSRSGELFPIMSTGSDGMTYVRAIPAADIENIETNPEDVENEIRVIERIRYDPATGINLGSRSWKVYDADTDNTPDEFGRFPTVILHFPINRPIGSIHGESDLAPVTKWLVRYAAWLEDRARLNRYRNTFLFFVKGKFASRTQRLERQAELNDNPPQPGSILVGDEAENWEVLSPKLESSDAATDGLALKKMISAGSGNPLHFLAEPESSTRTTAEASGGPTFRRYEQRQKYFTNMILQVAEVARARKCSISHHMSRTAELSAKTSDISARDNVSLATAAGRIYDTFAALRDRAMVDDAELLRIIYRFSGEVIDVEDMLRRGKAAGLPSLPVNWPITNPLTNPNANRETPSERGGNPSVVDNRPKVIPDALDDETKKEIENP